MTAYVNPLKRAWRAGRAALNLWMTIPSPWTAELLADCGYDTLTIDMQHGLADYTAAVTMMQSVAGAPVGMLCRTPWNDPALIMRLLDSGACGIICPLVNTRAEAETLVGACRYPPAGYRSFGPVRAGKDDSFGYVAAGAETAAVIAMIETAQALANVDAIAATPGLDALYIGPADMSISLGLEDVGNFQNPGLRRALDAVLAAANNNGIIAGCHAKNPADAAFLISLGFRLTTPADDTSLLHAAARAALEETRTRIAL